MADDDLDDFFEMEEVKDPSTSESATDPAAPTAQPPAPATPTPPSPTPGPPPRHTDDKLLADFGDFDALFDKAQTTKIESTPEAPPPAPSGAGQDPNIEDLLSEFGVDESTDTATQPAPPSTTAPANEDDLFEDFQGIKKEELTITQTKPSAQKPAAAASSAGASEVSRPEEALEELFSEVSQADAQEPESVSSEDHELGIEYSRKKRRIPKQVMIGAPAFLLLVGLIAVVMARFTGDGFFGWKFGQKPKDGYEAATGGALRKLDNRYKETIPLYTTDRIEEYRKALAALEGILKIDAHHNPAEARVAETELLIGDRAITSAARKRIQGLLENSNKYHPEALETLRAKARSQMVDGQLAQADTLARRALGIGAKDVETVTLLGEVALSRGDFDVALKQFTQALELNPKWARASHFLGVTKLQQGNVDEAEKIFRSLIDNVESPHPSSEVELWRLLYAHRGKVDEAREGLKKLIETKSASISNYDLGRSWKSLAEIAEAAKDVPAAITAMEKSVEADRSNHSHAFYLGRLYLNQKQFEKAAGEFGRASSLSPQTSEYLVYEGNALREMGKWAESLNELQKALEKDPSSVEGLFQLAITQRALSRFDESVASFENVLKNDPRHLDSMTNLGELYLARDNFTMAKTHLRSAISLSPTSVRAHNALGKLLLVTRKWDEALEEFHTAEKQDPKNVDVLSNLGRSYLAVNQVDKAGGYFEKALTLEPTRLDTQVALGELQHRRKEYVKALDTYRNVLKERPKDYDTRVKLAAVLIDQHSFQEAITELQEASKWSPNYYPTRLQLGIAWRGLGSLDASLEQLGLAVQIRPEAAEAHYQLELTQIFRNDPINAETAMEKALSYDPKYVTPLVSLGDYFDTRNLYEKAVNYYVRAEKIEPKNSEVLLKLAESYRRNEKPKEAKAYYLKTIGADPKISDAYLGLGLIAEDEGKQSKAIEYLRRAQSLDPSDPKPYYYLGFVYKDSNQKRPAVLAFKKYLQLDPSSKEKQDIEDQIYALTH